MKEARKIGLATGIMATIICGSLAFKVGDPELAGLILIVFSPMIGVGVGESVHDAIVAAVKRAQRETKKEFKSKEKRHFNMITMGEFKVDKLDVPKI